MGRETRRGRRLEARWRQVGPRSAIPKPDRHRIKYGVNATTMVGAMGWDSDEREIPCPCGKGLVVVTTTTPDHAYVTAYNTNHSVTIRCAPCSNIYVVDGTRLVRRTDMAASREARSVYEKARKALDATPEMAELKRAFAEHLGPLSVAATHRLLKVNGLESYEIGTFRKRWKGAEHWVEQHIGCRAVPKVLRLLNRTAPQLEAKLAELAALDVYPPVPTVLACLKEAGH